MTNHNRRQFMDLVGRSAIAATVLPQLVHTGTAVDAIVDRVQTRPKNINHLVVSNVDWKLAWSLLWSLQRVAGGTIAGPITQEALYFGGDAFDSAVRILGLCEGDAVNVIQFVEATR